MIHRACRFASKFADSGRIFLELEKVIILDPTLNYHLAVGQLNRNDQLNEHALDSSSKQYAHVPWAAFNFEYALGHRCEVITSCASRSSRGIK